jgi:hypothetical protein
MIGKTRSLALSALVIGSAMVAAGCGGAAAPSNAEAIEALKQNVTARQNAILARPRTANQELEMLTESVASYSDQYGAPFDGFLETVKATREELGANPKLDTVKSAAQKLVDAANSLGE